jgi:cobalt-zinc-cadmium efflux system outer membrane protein
MRGWEYYRPRVRWIGAGSVLLAGCLGKHVPVPGGQLPMPPAPADVQTAGALGPALPMPASAAPPQAAAQPARQVFELPQRLPGAEAPPVIPPRFQPNTPAAEREKAIRDAYPELGPVTVNIPATGAPVSLANVQQMALASSPVIRRAEEDSRASFGLVIQAGLHPNPTMGYEVDQWQPGPAPKHNNGQQGGFINQLVKFPGKLKLSQAVAGFDYLNSLVAVRRAQLDVMTAVRTAYFNALVARESVEVNLALAWLADEVYKLQLKQLAAGEAAGYEPLQLYAQAVQTRNGLSQAEAAYRAAWRQLAAAVGRPDLPPAPLAGRADLPAPLIDQDQIKATMLELHTDVMAARNSLAQAEVNHRLQRLTPYPDLQTNWVYQYDNAVLNPQFNVQLGVPVPVFDRNQGNIRNAEAQIARARQNIAAVQNDLTSRLAEAFGRYEAQRVIAERTRKEVLPSLARAYRAIVRRYQVEPDKVGFSDIVVAQQNYAQALQAYLTVLGAQWQAVIDLATLSQLDELFIGPPAPPKDGK